MVVLRKNRAALAHYDPGVVRGRKVTFTSASLKMSVRFP